MHVSEVLAFGYCQNLSSVGKSPSNTASKANWLSLTTASNAHSQLITLTFPIRSPDCCAIMHALGGQREAVGAAGTNSAEQRSEKRKEKRKSSIVSRGPFICIA